MFSLVKVQTIFSYSALIYFHLTWLLSATPQFGPPTQMSQQSPGPLGTNGARNSFGGPNGDKKDENHTAHFFLWNASAPTLEDQLVLMNENGSVPSKLWKHGGAIKVIIHGYHADYTLTPLQHLEDHKIPVIAEEYAKANSSLNIIIVEWSALAIQMAYPVSAENTKPVGRATAEFLLNLHKQKAFSDFSLVHLIGFSLGSHVSGVAGHQLQKLSKNKHKIGRITGLDPAGPLFDLDGGLMPDDTTGFLEKSDADFVDIIHCNMGTQHWSRAIPEGRLGSFVQAGHADFYPNGGMTQPHQCTPDLDKSAGCSHRCCVFYFAFSLTRPELACPCKTWEDYSSKLCTCDLSKGVYLGDPCSTSAKGKYYVEMTENLNFTKPAAPQEVPTFNPNQAQSVATRADKLSASASPGLAGASATQGVPDAGAPNLPGASTPQGSAHTGPSIPVGPQTRSDSSGGFSSKGEKKSDQSDEVHFFLFDSSGPNFKDQLILMEKDGSVPTKLWRPGGALKLIIHGYHADYTLTPIQHLEDHKIPVIAEEYSKANSSLNVIIVEWSGLAIRAAYPISADNTKIVGRATAEFLVNLYNKEAFSDFSLVHLIGFSLGSHVSGVAGHQLQKLTNKKHKIGRITGLDPAGPLFDLDGGLMPDDKTGFLERSDADFVDIIHCNMGTQHWSTALSEGKLGSFVQAGHADFYPNGGMTQLFQCTTELDKLTGCSHRCCVFYFAFSLTRPSLACPCNSWEDYSNKVCSCNADSGVPMGDPCPSKAKGKYYVEIKENLNMTMIKIPTELPSFNYDQKAQSAAGRLENVGADGTSPDVLTNRMGSSGNGTVPNAPNMQGATMPQGAPQAGTPNMQGASMPQGASTDGAPQFGGGQQGSPQVGMSQMGGNQTGTPQMDAPQFGGNQTGAPQFDAPQMDSPKMDAPQFGGNQKGAPQMGGNQTGAPQFGSPGMGGNQTGAPQFDASKMGGNQTGTPQFDAPQMDSPKMDAPQFGGSQNGAPQMGGNQTGTPQFGSPGMGGNQTGAPQFGSPGMGGNQTGAPQFGGPQMGGNQTGAPQFGSPGMGGNQTGAPQFGTPAMGGNHTGAPQFGSPGMGGNQTGAPQFGGPQMGGNQTGAPQFDGPQLGGNQTGAPQFGAPGMGGNQTGTPEFGSPAMGGPQMNSSGMDFPSAGATRSVGSNKMDVSPMGASQAGADQMGGAQMNSAQPGAPQMDTSQMTPNQSAATQFGVNQTGPPQMDMSQMGGNKTGAPQMDLNQMGGNQTGAPKMEFNKMGGNQTGPPQMGLDQMGGNKTGAPKMGAPQINANQTGLDTSKMDASKAGAAQMGASGAAFGSKGNDTHTRNPSNIQPMLSSNPFGGKSSKGKSKKDKKGTQNQISLPFDDERKKIEDTLKGFLKIG